MTVVGIRPDFIRMSEIIKKLDQNFNHIVVNTNQHYDQLLSDVFFNELKIREPDYNLEVGGANKEHFHQAAEISVKVIELLRREDIKPDIILFLGDSNSVCCAVQLKKEGHHIGHIEAGMRSHDKRMLEEINRTVCDHCSDLLFVYHDDYAKNLYKEGIWDEVYMVGNTIVEVCLPIYNELKKEEKRKDQILVDIHRPENFKHPERMANIVYLVKRWQNSTGFPAKWLEFPRTMKYLEMYGISLDGVELVDLMSYKQFLEAQYHSLFMISDSGTAQEEPAILQTPVIVPRDYTERPQSMQYNCSKMLAIPDKLIQQGQDIPSFEESYQWLVEIEQGKRTIDSSWLGNGRTSEKIVKILKGVL